MDFLQAKSFLFAHPRQWLQSKQKQDVAKSRYANLFV